MKIKDLLNSKEFGNCAVTTNRDNGWSMARLKDTLDYGRRKSK